MTQTNRNHTEPVNSNENEGPKVKEQFQSKFVKIVPIVIITYQAFFFNTIKAYFKDDECSVAAGIFYWVATGALFSVGLVYLYFNILKILKKINYVKI